MPHPNNNNWFSLLVGQEVDAPPPQSHEEMPHIRAAMDFSYLNTDMPSVGRVHERVVLRELDGWDLTAEIYVPEGDGPFPVILYMHGGGWCVGSPVGVRRKTMRLAERGFVVVNLDYSLAPGAPLPQRPHGCRLRGPMDNAEHSRLRRRRREPRHRRRLGRSESLGRHGARSARRPGRGRRG